MRLMPTGSMRRGRRNEGSMLVIALGVLALLSILAVTFVSLMKLELLASKNYVDGVKARLVAEGGLEEAITELKNRNGLDAVSNPNDDWVYASGRYWIPLEEATTKRDKSDPNDYANRCSFVGNLGQSYARGKDQYKIQVIDTQAQFNLNNVFDNSFTLDQQDRESNVYTRALRALGEAIHKLNPRAKAANIDPVKEARYPLKNPQYFGADAILKFRLSLEGKMFTSKYQLTEILPTPEHYKLIRDYVTTKSWMDPKSVVPFKHDGINEAFTDLSVKKPNPGELPDQRAPINVNLAPVEVIAANLAGLCGRAMFMYYGPRTGTGLYKKIDEDYAKFIFNQQLEEYDLEYLATPVQVYFGPMGYRPGNTVNDPVIIDGAIAIAQLIVNRRQLVAGTGGGGYQGPFKSYADWERWVDQNLTDQFFQTTRDSTGNNAFPQPETAPMFLAKDHSIANAVVVSGVRTNPRYRSWFYDCLRSIIKANCNPNGRMSMLNPNTSVFLEVDKGNLQYPKELVKVPAGTAGAGDKFNSQTCEWCFGSKGIFEITSLGEILGPDKNDPTKVDAANPYAAAKVLTVVQIFDQVVHTSQRDFERNGHPQSFTASMSGYGGWGDEKGQAPPGNGNRFGIASYPFPKVFWDPRVGPVSPIANPTDADRNRALELGGPDEGWHAHDDSGHLEIAPRVQISEAGNDKNDTTVTNFGSILFALLFQDRKIRPPDNTTGPLSPRQWDIFLGDRSYKTNQNPNHGQPWAGEVTTGFAFPHPFRVPGSTGLEAAITGYDAGTLSGSGEMYQKLVNPDGMFVDDVRNLPLWYRAADRLSNNSKASPGVDGWPPGGGRQGDSVANPSIVPGWEGGNVTATPRGGVEFWYKPEFDWYARGKAWSSAGTEPNPTYVTGASGDAVDERFCGLMSVSHCTLNKDATHWDLFEGPRPTRGTEMWITRNTLGDLRVTRLYFEVVGEPGYEIPWVTDIVKGGNGPDPKSKIRLGGTGGYMDKATTMPEYTWPPLEFQAIPKPWFDIKYARVDAWVPAVQLKAWRAREWHHVGIRWDDTAALGPAKADSIEIYLDGVLAPTVQHQIGPHYQGVVNTVAQPADPTNPTMTDMPSFVRVNHPEGRKGDAENGRRPKDEIQLGSFHRKQAKRGGLFKFKYDYEPELTANGTLDDVRFYDGAGARVSGFADRYEEYGIWTNEIDLSDRFVPGNDFLELGNLQFTAYLPMQYGAARCAGNRSGAGSVEVSFKIIKAAGGTGGGSEITYTPAGNYDGWIREFTDNQGSIGGFKLIDPSGRPAVVARGDRLVYTVRMFPARLQGGVIGGDSGDRSGFAVATPALDDVTIVYFLPTARILLKERVWD